jgi:putative DNA primase/helicase
LWCVSCADRAAIAAALRSAGGGSLPSPRPERLPRLDRADPAARVARALAIWSGAAPIEDGSPAAKYLELRRISHVMRAPALRWRADVPHPAGGRHLALLAAVSGADGKLSGIQRVFLKTDGTKADCEPQKASLGVIAGGACRLQNASSELVVAEGIESAAAAGALLGLPAWAAISAGNLAKLLILPPEIRTIVIAADNDPAGLRAAEAAWRRWRAEGRECRIVKPVAPDEDFNDLQRAKAQRGAR